MSICERISQARGGDLLVKIEPVVAQSAEEAARLFGLFDSPNIYFEVSAREAEAVIGCVLETDMAYGSPLISHSEAVDLARSFMEQFSEDSPRYYTNGEYGQPKERPGIGPSWHPATKHTFDTGVLVLTSQRTACAWFMDED